MRNLKVIKFGNQRYLGVAGLFFIEVPDRDKTITTLLPANIKFKPSETLAYTGRNLRMVLRNNKHDCLAIIKNSKSPIKGEKRAELICFVNNSGQKDQDLLNDLRVLASHRWPSGILFVKNKPIKNHKGLTETLLKLGWKFSQLKSGVLELQLLKQ